MTYDLIPKLIALLFWLIICFGVSKIGKKRRIGSFYSFFISATISPLIGFIATIFSPLLKSSEAYLENTTTRKVFGIVFYCLSLLIVVASIYTFSTSINQYEVNYWPEILSSIGFFTLGEYLYRYPIPAYDEIKIVMPENETEKIKVKQNFNENPASNFHLRKPLVKKISYCIAFIFLLLAVTNPSSKKFKEFLGTEDDSQIRRISNWGIFSIHQDKTNDNRYLGIFLTFYEIK
jgi:hypothetical protein